MSTCINWLTNFLGNSRRIGAENGPFCSLELQEPLFQMKSFSFFLVFYMVVCWKSSFQAYFTALELLVLMIMQWNRIGRPVGKKNLLKHFFLEDGSGFCRSSVQVVKVRFLNFFSPEKTQLLTRAKISCHPKNDGYVILKDFYKKDWKFKL